MCIILNQKLNLIANSGYFGGKFLYMGAFFSVWKKLMGENLKFIFQGQILFYRGQFSVWRNLKSLF